MSKATQEIKRITTHQMKAMKGRGEKISMLTAYDYSMARIIDSTGIDVILVGDSASNVMAGHETTLPITLDQMIYHAASVVRAVKRAFVVVDIPFGYYQGNSSEALRSAIRIMKESGAHAVKMEGGSEIKESVTRILSAGVPVMGHLGLTPQSVHAMGGYKVQGKATEAARDLIRDALALADAGVFAVVLEGVPTLVAEIITKEVSVPTIGIGAGPHTDGQVLVFDDVLGLHDGHLPKFVRQYARLQDAAVQALSEYFADVEQGSFPSEEESYDMSEEAARALLRDEPRGDPFDAF